MSYTKGRQLVRQGSAREEVMGLQRKTSIKALSKASPFGKMLEAVKQLASARSLWDDEMQRDLPKKWEKHGDMIVFPQNSFTHNNWRYLVTRSSTFHSSLFYSNISGRELWKVVADSLNIGRLGRKRMIADDLDRTPHVDILYGPNGWIDYVDERGIRFVYDASKRVFNNSKTREMARIAHWDCHGETVVDMYASLGYYAFLFLLTCKAKKVVAIDWDDDMAEALFRTAEANEVTEKISIVQGDSRRVTPQGLADRVYLGLVPTCKAHWLTACKALKPEGGMLHIQDQIDTRLKISPRKEMKRMPSKLASVDEEGASKENKPLESEHSTESSISVTNEVDKAVDAEAEVVVDENGEPRQKKKFSRSASIVEEMESRVFPEPKIFRELEEGTWGKLQPVFKDYALDCATSCTRFLNNIHFSDTLYGVTIVGFTRYGNPNVKDKNVEHFVLDLLCAPESVSIERLTAKFLNSNIST